MVTMDFGKRQTIAASPAEPGDLPHGLVVYLCVIITEVRQHTVDWDEVNGALEIPSADP